MIENREKVITNRQVLKNKVTFEQDIEYKGNVLPKIIICTQSEYPSEPEKDTIYMITED